MNIKKLRENLYHAYQLDWMIKHGYSLEYFANLISSIANDRYQSNYYDYNEPEDITSNYEEFANTAGFGGELYVCYEEFLENEYRDFSYMNTLINLIFHTQEKRFAMKKKYLKDIGYEKGLVFEYGGRHYTPIGLLPKGKSKTYRLYKNDNTDMNNSSGKYNYYEFYYCAEMALGENAEIFKCIDDARYYCPNYDELAICELAI